MKSLARVFAVLFVLALFLVPALPLFGQSFNPGPPSVNYAAPAVVAAADPVPAPAVPGIPPDGIDRSKMPHDGQSRYMLNGWPADEKTVFAAVAEEDALTDDSALPWVTVIGPDADRAAVLKDFRSNFALAAIRCRLKGYPPGHPAVKDFPPGLIHLQAPNGRPLFSAAKYEGPDKLAEAVKVALAGYDASKDPGPGKEYPKPDPPAPVVVPPAPAPVPAPIPTPMPGPGPTTVPVWVVVAGVLGLLFIAFGRSAK